MNTPNAPNVLATLAKTYTARAQPVPGARMRDDGDADLIEVEVRIATRINDAVRIRAASQNQTVAAVARAVLFREAARAQPDPEAASAARPRLRGYREDRYRLRFTAPRAAYGIASQAIQASGQSVAAVVEAGLRRYAQQGHL